MVIIRLRWTPSYDKKQVAGWYCRGPSAGTGVWIAPSMQQATRLELEDAERVAAFIASGGNYEAVEILPA